MNDYVIEEELKVPLLRVDEACARRWSAYDKACIEQTPRGIVITQGKSRMR